MGGTDFGSAHSSEGAGTRAHQSPSLRSAGASRRTASSRGSCSCAARHSATEGVTSSDTKCGKTRSHAHVPAGKDTPLRPAASVTVKGPTYDAS
eukprot:10177553-Alexandrium_andersonii.AAC.1